MEDHFEWGELIKFSSGNWSIYIPACRDIGVMLSLDDDGSKGFDAMISLPLPIWNQIITWMLSYPEVDIYDGNPTYFENCQVFATARPKTIWIRWCDLNLSEQIALMRIPAKSLYAIVKWYTRMQPTLYVRKRKGHTKV